MKIIVCININKDDSDTDAQAKNDNPSIMDTDNENALETALVIKDNNPATEVIAIGAGEPDMEDMLRECIARGVDDAILITGKDFDFTSPWTMAQILAKGIKTAGSADLIIAGGQTFDLDIIQITPQLSEKLDMPLISHVTKLEMKDNTAIVHSELENSSLELETGLPCILSVRRDINTPRYTKIQDMMSSLSADMKIWDIADIGIEKDMEITEQPVDTLLAFPLKPRDKGITIEGDSPEDIADKLMNHLRKRTVL